MTVHGVVRSESAAAIVMELVEGGSRNAPAIPICPPNRRPGAARCDWRDFTVRSTTLTSMSIVGTTAVIQGQASANGAGSYPLQVIRHRPPCKQADLVAQALMPVASTTRVDASVTGGYTDKLEVKRP